MIDWLVGYALRKRLVVAMICVFVAIYGYYSWKQLAIEAYPDIAEVTVDVITQATGLAAEEVEQQVTIQLERELNGTPGLLTMRSVSTFGLSSITLPAIGAVMVTIRDWSFDSGLTPIWRNRASARVCSASAVT